MQSVYLPMFFIILHSVNNKECQELTVTVNFNSISIGLGFIHFCFINRTKNNDLLVLKDKCL